MDYLTNTYYPYCVIDLGFADIVKYGPSSTSKNFAVHRRRHKCQPIITLIKQKKFSSCHIPCFGLVISRAYMYFSIFLFPT